MYDYQINIQIRIYGDSTLIRILFSRIQDNKLFSLVIFHHMNKLSNNFNMKLLLYI